MKRRSDVVRKRREGGAARTPPMYDVRWTMYDLEIRAPVARGGRAVRMRTARRAGAADAARLAPGGAYVRLTFWKLWIR